MRYGRRLAGGEGVAFMSIIIGWIGEKEGEQVLFWIEVVGAIAVVIAAVTGLYSAIKHHNVDKRFDKAERDSEKAHAAIGTRIDAVAQALNGLAREVSFLAGRRQGEADALARKDEK